ncbi:DUF2199 domain-containing protein [Ectobacillus sp. JY-23]|uniref:DUF2199 domain-containing protein n=1 Tax=Ectobacillus sp. JY-23 TaxID=2933872 RepID=UPI001FF1B3FE|nr:DUF2199 domain-containing protein [Ectobacillus sp. JY-23]UOY94606.1 DUF2199 domain-containing protein [Ectobacillus sp. JY-23]
MRNYTKGYVCRCCGKYHDELPMSYGSPVPDYVYEIPMEEVQSRVEMNEDLCVIDEKLFFIRGCIEIPVLDGEETFIWDVWVSLSEENFGITIDSWEEEGREHQLEPMFGWLSTSIPCYPETINLKTMVHTREVGVRPYIELEPTQHPLAVEQREGIGLERIKQIAQELCNQEEQ